MPSTDFGKFLQSFFKPFIIWPAMKPAAIPPRKPAADLASDMTLAVYAPPNEPE